LINEGNQAAIKVGIMKGIIVNLIMILAAAGLLSVAASSGTDFAGILGPDKTVLSTPGTDAKKVQDKIAEALVRLDSWKKARAEEKREPLVGNSNQVNSTLDNISINGSLSNSSQHSPSVDQDADVQDAAAGEIDANTNTNSTKGLQNVGASSRGSFDGYYGMTASRHEMGKSGVNSRMFLSGTFEMDKSVKFQDRGI
jgi:hypothetical protein